jgi:uncharacterized protein YdeI (YjbR/CyaY-like superfamily)
MSDPGGRNTFIGGNYEQVLAESPAQWRAWLEAHHGTSPGIWLITWKKASGRPLLSYDAIVDEALCYGWVDSRPRSIDSQQSARLITPRKPASNWSARNKTRVEQLTAAGRMQPPGLAAVAAAKANGAWTALDQVETLTEPPDLTAALDATPSARYYWDAFPRSARRAILEWIGNAKTSTTRQARIQRTAHDASRNIRANQWKQPGARASDPARQTPKPRG